MDIADSMKTVTFILEFKPSRHKWREPEKALVALAPELKVTCLSLFQYWHASRHICDGEYNQLWLRFQTSPNAVDDLIRRAEKHLKEARKEYGFELQKVIVEDELKAFGYGDPRPGYDVIEQIGGPDKLPKLWAEIEQATEWASHDIVKNQWRDLPHQWESWSIHIYGNVLGKE